MKLSNIAPKIVQANFLPQSTGMVQAVALLDGGEWVVLFTYNPREISFTRQELIGLSRQEAKMIKDRKLDDFIGFNQY